MEIELGNGLYFVSPVIDHDGKRGIMCRKSPTAYPVGSKDPNWVEGTKYTPTDDDVFIWCENIESAHVLQNAVNAMMLQMSGFSVTDEPVG